MTGRHPLEVQADRSRDLSGNAVTTTVTWHSEPLRPGRYTIEGMADGIRDLSGNAVATTVTSHFEVAP